MKKVDVILGLQWGDEGKGKVVDVLTPHYQVVARFQVPQCRAYIGVQRGEVRVAFDPFGYISGR